MLPQSTSPKGWKVLNYPTPVSSPQFSMPTSLIFTISSGSIPFVFSFASSNRSTPPVKRAPFCDLRLPLKLQSHFSCNSLSLHKLSLQKLAGLKGTSHFMDPSSFHIAAIAIEFLTIEIKWIYLLISADFPVRHVNVYQRL